jgi:hypothetical protein
MRLCRRSHESGVEERSRGTWLRLALRVCRAVGPVVLAGCGSGSDHRPAAAGQAQVPRASQVARVSCTDEATRACTVELGTHASVTSCLAGTQQCSGGTWGPCRQARPSVASDRVGLVGRLALSGLAVACQDNFCDPTCRNFLETPAGGLVAEPDPSGATTRMDATLWWQGGSALDLPAESQGGVCYSAEDCSFGQACADVATQPACVHNKCEEGAALVASCDPCVEQVCQLEPTCCADGASPDDDRHWTQACVEQVESACRSTCDASKPATAAHCTPWLPGESTPSCAGYDLAIGIPCVDTVPVCNHGNVEVPAGVTLVHFPAGSVDLSSCAPDAADAVTCTTREPIRPGRCVAVTDCSDLDEARDVLVNPDGAGHVDECTCSNNWVEYVPGRECQDRPSCFSARMDSAPRLHAFFAVEKSAWTLSGGATGWSEIKSGLTALFTSPDAAGVDVAMELFPSDASDTGNDGCFSDASCTSAVAQCANPAVPSGVLTAATGAGDAQEAALLKALLDAWPSGSTPTAAALEGALTAMRDAALENPSDTYAVVLLGRGMSDVCVTDSSYLIAVADLFYRQWGILTFTVALDGADDTVMAAIAEAGGTGTSRVYSGWDASAAGRSLLRDLVAASGAVLPCTTDLGNAERIDPMRAVVRYLHGDGSSEALDPVEDAADCAADGAGWYYDDAASPASLTLCPATCSLVRADVGAEVHVELPCLGDPAPLLQTTTVSEVYESDCPEGTQVQWGFIGYSASTPSDSRITLSARTASQVDELQGASPRRLATITAESGNEQCEITAGCYIDLWQALGGVPAARRSALELQVSLVPSTTNETPVLTDWQITYSCPASD